MIKAIDANLIAKKANEFSGTLRMLYQKIYCAAACGHDCVTVLLDGSESNHIEELLCEYGFATKIISGLPTCGYVMLDIMWKF